MQCAGSLRRIELQHNANGNCLSDGDGIDNSLYVYDEVDRLIGEYEKTGAPRQETVYLGDTPIALIQGAALYYVYADHLNTPRVITNTANTTLWRRDSDPFGTNPPNEDPDGDGVRFTYNLRFPGQYFDKETGLHYNYFRDYDPGTGRYVQSDPIGLMGGINTYAYANQNPLMFTDPDGLEPDPLSSSSGSRGFSPAPTPFDVFIPGTPANNAFVKNTTGAINKIVKMCKGGVSEEDEAECHAQYERDLDECKAYRRAQGPRWYAACTTNAFQRYQTCRGY